MDLETGEKYDFVESSYIYDVSENEFDSYVFLPLSHVVNGICINFWFDELNYDIRCLESTDKLLEDTMMKYREIIRIKQQHMLGISVLYPDGRTVVSNTDCIKDGTNEVNNESEYEEDIPPLPFTSDRGVGT